MRTIISIMRNGFALRGPELGHRSRWLVAWSLLVFWWPVSASQLHEENSCTYFLSGDIDSGTPAQVKAAIGISKPLGCQITFRFDSNGGDVGAAMEVGEVLRSTGAVTIVPVPASCASACVIAFVGGALRIVAGRIGLHRPFPIVAVTSLAEASARREKLNAELRAYLSRMHISVRLLEEINAVPSGSIRWLDGARGRDGDEINRLQIAGDDPSWTEYRDSKRSKDLGISLAEFYKRKQRGEVECPEGDGTYAAGFRTFQCRSDVLSGKKR